MLLWDKEKNKRLIKERNLNFEVIAEIIFMKQYIDIVQHPKRENQLMFIIRINDYIHAVPFVVDKDGNIILKTIFPSRKYHKIYGGK